MYRVICHLDMDAFYASVEQGDNPALRGQPVIVGAPPTQRGEACAASYEARKFGVRSAMASVTAKRLCPDGCFVRPRLDAYHEESRRIMTIIASTGAVVEQMSVDEAYLDVSSACQAEVADASLRLALPLARELKTRIRDERLLSATIGIAANKLLATPPATIYQSSGLGGGKGRPIGEISLNWEAFFSRFLGAARWPGQSASIVAIRTDAC